MTTPATAACSVLMRGGPRKNQECGRKLVEGSHLCRYHYNQAKEAEFGVSVCHGGGFRCSDDCWADDCQFCDAMWDSDSDDDE